MSLTASLNTSISGLAVAQAGLALVSNNVANANTPGYTRKVAEQEARIAGDIRSGVLLAEVKRAVDRFLLRDVRVAGGTAGRFDSQLLILDRLQALFGQPDANSSLPGRLDRVFAAFESASATPASITHRGEIVNALTALSREITRSVQEVNSLRRDADQQIAIEVGEINAALLQIEFLNNSIAAAKAAGRDATEFEDKRDIQIAKITERVDIKVFEQADGRVALFLGGTIPLLENNAGVLVFTPAAEVKSGTSFGHIEVFRRDLNTGEPTGVGTPIEPAVNDGRIRGLLDLRDGELANLVVELGEFASRVADELNRIHNDNTAFPAPNVLEGARNSGLVGSDALNFTGAARFAVVDAQGTVVETVTVDFSALATIDDAIAAVNAGLGGAGTLSIANGVMRFAATNPAHGAAVAQDEADPSGRAGRGFAHYFGLNDLMSTSVSTFLETGFVTTDTHGFTGDSTVTVLDRNGAVAKVFTFDAGAAGVTFTDLVNALNDPAHLNGFGTASLDTNGRLRIDAASGFEIRFDDELTADRNGTGIGLAALMGLGADKLGLNAETIAVRAGIAADPTLLGLGKLQPGLAGETGITSGDGRGARALANIASSNVRFSAAGDLPGHTTTLSGYAGAILGGAALYAAAVKDLAAESADLHNSLKLKLDSLAGVNVDEELANMIILQNAFAASARVITTIDRMLEELISLGRR